MIRFLLSALLAFAVTSSGVAQATIIESGDLNIIDDAGNPSDGLHFLDLTYSDGLTLAAALANAQATYADARLATPDEWDDLFAAAGITYTSSYTAADAFTTGPALQLTGILQSVVTLIDQLGTTSPALDTFIFSDPDGSGDAATTRDYMFLSAAADGIAYVYNSVPIAPNTSVGWLIVSETAAVPEPSTALLLSIGLLGLAKWRR